MSSLEKLAAKYFRRNPVAPIPRLGGFGDCVVIPAMDEMDELPHVLDSIRAAGDAAILVVVNSPPGAPVSENLATLELLVEREKCDKGLFHIHVHGLAGGVGAARKLGMDIFAASHSSGDLPECWIFSIDGDSPVSPDYFRRAHETAASGATALVMPFAHRPVAGLESEINRYEAYLHRYVDRLRAAGSPYAHHTVGSAFAVRADAYVRVSGMKARQAGEDFYFINELVKFGGVSDVQGPPTVFPSGRLSHRTPFGTGRAVERLAAGNQLDEIPDSAFDELASLLKKSELPGELESANRFMAGLSPAARRFLELDRFPAAWDSAVASIPASDAFRRDAFRRWFDALKTRRFLYFASRMRGSAAMYSKSESSIPSSVSAPEKKNSAI